MQDTVPVVVHATDVSMTGSRRAVHLLRAALAESLGDEVVYLTWDDDSQHVEDHARESSRAIGTARCPVPRPGECAWSHPLELRNLGGRDDQQRRTYG